MINIHRKLEIFLRLLFLGGLFASVFVFWPKAEIAFEIPKVWFIARWIEVLIIVTFFTLRTLKKEKIDPVLIAFILAFLVISIISSYFGVSFSKSIAGNYYRGDGLLMFLHFLILYFVVVLFSTKDWLFGFIKIISISSVILGLISLFQWLIDVMGIRPIETWDGGLGNVFGNPNFLAGYLIVTLPLVGYFVDFSIGKRKLLALIGLLIQISGIFLTNAWVGYFGVILFLFFWLGFKYKKYRFLLIFVGIFLLMFIGLKFVNYQNSLETPISINPESRSRIFMKAMLAFKERPLLGYGWANFDKVFEMVDYPIHMDQDVYVDKAHSAFLEVLTTTGALGLILYLMIIIKVLINLLKRRNTVYRYIIAAFVLLIMHMQTNVISVSEETLFWIIAGFSTKKAS